MAVVAGEVIVKAGMEPTDEMKAFIRQEVRKALAEILEQQDDLREFVQKEVNRALAEDNHFHLGNHAPYHVNLETKHDSPELLPEWARKAS